MNGGSLKDVQEILSHGDMRMTLRYAHLSAAHKQAAVDALDGLTAPLPAQLAHRLAQGAPRTGNRLRSSREISLTERREVSVPH